MGKFLIVLLLIVVGVAALGYYLRWYDVSIGRDPDGRREIKLLIGRV
jgi:hypothetical protein